MIRSAVLTQYTRVTDGQTDGQTEVAWHIRAIAYMLSRVKTGCVLFFESPRCGIETVITSKTARTAQSPPSPQSAQRTERHDLDSPCVLAVAWPGSLMAGG